MNEQDITFVLIKFADNTVGVMQVLYDVIALAEIDSEIKRSTFVKQVVSWRIIDPEQIPLDRTFRGAWEYDESAVLVNMDKAREIHKNILRSLRLPIFEQLDAEFTKALESGDITEQQRIAILKQELRDVTEDPRIVEARTPEELKAIIPAILQ